MKDIYNEFKQETGIEILSIGENIYQDWLEEKLIEAREELERAKKKNAEWNKLYKDKNKELKETLLDIINSENSGLSAEQRLNEIKKELQHNPC